MWVYEGVHLSNGTSSRSTKEANNSDDWNLLRASPGPMPVDWKKAATNKQNNVSPLAQKLEARRRRQEQEKEKNLNNERVQHSIHTFNALALGEVKAKTLDGRENANLEETQGKAVFSHLAMRSGTLHEKRFQEGRPRIQQPRRF